MIEQVTFTVDMYITGEISIGRMSGMMEIFPVVPDYFQTVPKIIEMFSNVVICPS